MRLINIPVSTFFAVLATVLLIAQSSIGIAKAKNEDFPAPNAAAIPNMTYKEFIEKQDKEYKKLFVDIETKLAKVKKAPADAGSMDMTMWQANKKDFDAKFSYLRPDLRMSVRKFYEGLERASAAGVTKSAKAAGKAKEGRALGAVQFQLDDQDREKLEIEIKKGKGIKEKKQK